ncbi:MAG: LCP family protein [Acidimicrobiia bacterium]
MAEPVAEEHQRSGVAAALLGAFIPGLGHGYVGHWWRALFMALPLVLLIATAALATRVPTFDLLGLAVRPAFLRGVLVANAVVVVWRVAAVADPYRLSKGHHNLWGFAAVALLSFVVALPHVLVARYTLDAAYVLDEVFVSADDAPASERAVEASVREPFVLGNTAIFDVPDPALVLPTVTPVSSRNMIFREGVGDPEAVAHAMEFQQKTDQSIVSLFGSEASGADRITILLAGGDGGPGRGGSRTDAIMVATFDVVTGKAAIFGVPRNMTHAPLPESWSTAFVDLEKRLIPYAERKKWTDDDGDGEPDQFTPCNCFPDQINAIYPFTRAWYETYPDEPDPGLAALRDTLEIMLGLEIDYYAMVNMSGFVRVVDALGGIRAYVTSTVQTEVSPAREGEDWITINLRPGWRTLNGHDALAYVRERRSASDYTRMKRQRCLLKAVAAKADPGTILTRFTGISKAVASSVKTDIDIDYLPTLLGYAAALDFSDVATVGFVPPFYTPDLDHRGKPTPDLPRIHEAVANALSADADTVFETGDDSECRI